MDFGVLSLGIMVGFALSVKGISSVRSWSQRFRRPVKEEWGLPQHAPLVLPTTSERPLRRPSVIPSTIDLAADLFEDRFRDAPWRTGGLTTTRRLEPTREPFGDKNIIEKWRESVIGLIKLANSNLQLARSQVSLKNYREAFEAAATSVENISRALLHCFGERPELKSGQEEPLRLLALRLAKEEKPQFERAIDEVVYVNQNRITEADLSKERNRERILNEARARSAIETAINIQREFMHVIVERFSGEIPELSEKCPRCHALDVRVWAFDQLGERLQCEICGFRYTQQRKTE